MKRVLRLLPVVLALACLGMARGPKVTVRFYTEANPRDTEAFSKPITFTNPHRQAFIEKVPSINERSIKTMYPFQAADGTWGAAFLLPFGWTVLANSVGATLLLLWLLGRGAAGQVTGLFFLVPPVTALGAAMLLGEAPGAGLVAAILLGAAALWLLQAPAGRTPAAG
jgi:hypothetical protein